MSEYEIKTIAVSYRLEPEVLAELATLQSLRPGRSAVEVIRELITTRFKQELEADRTRVQKQKKAADEEIQAWISSLKEKRKTKR
jgi:hypothetical protein